MEPLKLYEKEYGLSVKNNYTFIHIIIFNKHNRKEYNIKERIFDEKNRCIKNRFYTIVYIRDWVKMDLKNKLRGMK